MLNSFELRHYLHTSLSLLTLAPVKPTSPVFEDISCAVDSLISALKHLNSEINESSNK